MSQTNTRNGKREERRRETKRKLGKNERQRDVSEERERSLEFLY